MYLVCTLHPLHRLTSGTRRAKSRCVFSVLRPRSATSALRSTCEAGIATAHDDVAGHLVRSLGSIQESSRVEVRANNVGMAQTCRCGRDVRRFRCQVARSMHPQTRDLEWLRVRTPTLSLPASEGRVLGVLCGLSHAPSGRRQTQRWWSMRMPRRRRLAFMRCDASGGQSALTHVAQDRNSGCVPA